MDGVEGAESMTSTANGLARRPVMGIRLGRGRTGGSTFVDMLVQRARTGGRKVVIADGDLRNPTLSGLYPPGTAGGAMQPQSDDLVDMKDLFTTALGQAVSDNASLLVDFGGGDRVMLEYGENCRSWRWRKDSRWCRWRSTSPARRWTTSTTFCRSGGRASSAQRTPSWF